VLLIQEKVITQPCSAFQVVLVDFLPDHQTSGSMERKSHAHLLAHEGPSLHLVVAPSDDPLLLLLEAAGSNRKVSAIQSEVNGLP